MTVRTESPTRTSLMGFEEPSTRMTHSVPREGGREGGRKRERARVRVDWMSLTYWLSQN